MAFGVKYRMDFEDQFQGDDFRIDIEKEDYVDSIIGLGHEVNSAFTLDYNSDQDAWIIGSEGKITFIASQDDTAAYDADFYDSTFRDMKVKFYVNSVLKWVGWLKPENTTRQFLDPNVEYILSATDGLNDLQDIDYTGFIDAGKQDTLQIIKNVLVFNAIDDIDILIQCNLFEDQLMIAGQNVFNTLQNNNKEFYSTEDGEAKADKCFDVLEKCIKPYYCRLYQSDGLWKIVNGQEYVSEADTFDYTTLAFSGSSDVAVDREVDISDHFRPAQNQFELSKIPPLKNLRLIFRNKNLGDNEIATNPDFEDGGVPPSGWTNSGWDVFQTTLEDGNNVGETTESTTNNDEKYIQPGTFTLAGVAPDTDALIVRFRIKLKSITIALGIFPQVFVTLIDPNTNEVDSPSIRITEIDGDFTTIEHSFNLTVDGIYTLRLKVQPLEDTSQLTYYWDDLEVIHSATANSTTDSLYVNALDADGYHEKEEIIYFADSLQNSDIGALSDGESSQNLTTSWTRFDATGENLPLAQLFAQQYLNDQQGYQNLLTIDLHDVTEELSFNSILTFDSKKYRFLSYSKNYKAQLITATILEVNNGDASFTYNPQSLTSVFGQSTTLIDIGGGTTVTQSSLDAQLTAYGKLAENETITGDWISTGQLIANRAGNPTIGLATAANAHFIVGTVSDGLIMDPNELFAIGEHLNIGTAEAHEIIFYREWVEGMRLTDNGLGIGKIPSATMLLDVDGNIRAATGNTIFIGTASITETKISDWDAIEADGLKATDNVSITGLWDFINASGLEVGGATITSSLIGQWNTAFGWGNHADENYAQFDATESISGAWTWTSNPATFNNNIELRLGSGGHFLMDHDGTHAYFNQTAEGNLLLQDDGSTKFTFQLTGANSGILTCVDVTVTG